MSKPNRTGTTRLQRNGLHEAVGHVKGQRAWIQARLPFALSAAL